jgi:hypothetical protein
MFECVVWAHLPTELTLQDAQKNLPEKSQKKGRYCEQVSVLKYYIDKIKGNNHRWQG